MAEEGQQEVIKAPAKVASGGLVTKLANRFEVEPSKLLTTLKSTVFRVPAKNGGTEEISNEEMMALLVVADQYKLNPFTRELFAFPNKSGGIVPVVSVDGWSRIINEHPQFDGLTFEVGPGDEAKYRGAPAWIECIIHRKDRSHPIVVREWMRECFRDTGPWQSHPGRMLRHKSLIQCARLAFGFAGIYDEDEAARIVEGEATRVQNAAVDDINAALTPRPAPIIIDGETGIATQAGTGGGVAPEPPAAEPPAEPAKPSEPPAAEPAKPKKVTYGTIAVAISSAKTKDALHKAEALIDTNIDDMMRRDELHVIAAARLQRL
ncbi:MAG TPA: phage recombination protein Bet [Vicinamibacterales bacterium]|jgi:phage recombination protein Bet|nr:phage recombination protein Bet [Vicinamibacterales bacterium]